MKLFQDDKGNTSALRVIVVPGAMVGIVIALAGAVAMFLNLPASAAGMATGAGVVTAAMGAKAWQKANEGR